jgi:oligoendopeptidase F
MSIDSRNWESLQAQYEALKQKPLNEDNVQDWLRQWSDLESLIYEDSGNAASRAHENTADGEAEALHLHYVREILPRVQVAHEELKKRLLALEGYQPPADQERMMQRFRTGQRLFREENVPLETEVSVLSNEYRKVTGQMNIEWEGKTLTLDQGELLFMLPQREQREEAWHKIHRRWLQDRDALNGIFLQMLELRRQIARQADFDNYRDYAWLDRGRFEYAPDDAFQFHDAIEQEVVPVASRIYERRRAALGVETLRPWDLDVEPSGEPALAPYRDVSDLEQGTSQIFHAVDPVLGEQFDLLREGYLDLESRANKAPGGYCRSLPVSQRSYIFMNAVGKHDNVQTLLHEGGHAFHNQHTFHLPLLWMRHPGAEMAEVASMAMEMLSQPYLEREKGGFYSPEDARRARLEHLETTVLFFPYMAVVDAFQHWVYADAPEDVTAADLDSKWSELWDRFRPGIDFSGLQDEKETGWHRKRHIFVYPFYYIEYGLAQAGALQVWRNAMKDPRGALAAYRHALSLGGTRPLPELYEAAGIRLAFDRATLRDLMTLVEEKLDELAGSA